MSFKGIAARSITFMSMSNHRGLTEVTVSTTFITMSRHLRPSSVGMLIISMRRLRVSMSTISHYIFGYGCVNNVSMSMGFMPMFSHFCLARVTASTASMLVTSYTNSGFFIVSMGFMTMSNQCCLARVIVPTTFMSMSFDNSFTRITVFTTSMLMTSDAYNGFFYMSMAFMSFGGHCCLANFTVSTMSMAFMIIVSHCGLFRFTVSTITMFMSSDSNCVL